MNELQNKIAAALQQEPDRKAALTKALGLVLADFRSETGTIHSLDAQKQLLHLTTQVGLPPQMLNLVSVIPVGKGIAGETAARGKPVTICNLQTDKSGVAKPGAKQTGVGGALCVPIRSGDKIVGTLGVGTAREYEYTADETQTLEAIGRLMGARLVA